MYTLHAELTSPSSPSTSVALLLNGLQALFYLMRTVLLIGGRVPILFYQKSHKWRALELPAGRPPV